MRKLILTSCAIVSLSHSALGAEDFVDAPVFNEVYSRVQNEYVHQVNATETAVNVIKGLNKVDAKLRVADDNKRVSLYYNGRIVKSFLKPEKHDDIDAAVRLTGRMIKAAQKVSKKADEKDFELTDIILEDGINNHLDGDSKYYPTFSAEKKGLLKNRRNFASRKIDDILYIKIRAFNKHTVENFEQTFKDNPDFSGVILDLRSSPGGSLSEALKVADAFLDGEIMASARGHKSDSQQYYNALPEDVAQDKPLVVLVDGKTTSSAEVVAAALQDQSRAKIVGTNTYGKGTRQDLFELPNGAQLGVTTAYFYTPSEKALDKKGIQPDICTFEMLERKNLDAIIKQQAKENCRREERENKNVDLDIASALIKSRM